jgi:hypothetical protein
MPMDSYPKGRASLIGSANRSKRLQQSWFPINVALPALDIRRWAAAASGPPFWTIHPAQSWVSNKANPIVRLGTRRWLR